MKRISQWPLFPLTILIIMVSASAVTMDHSSAPDEASLSINGTVFRDMNADGIFTPGESVLKGWTVRLMQNGAQISVATSDWQGGYIFENLTAGLYDLNEDHVPGWNMTVPGSGSYQVRLTDKPAFGLDWGNFKPSDVAASVSIDTHPVMRPSPEEAGRWTEQYNMSPGAYISPTLAAEMEEAPGAYFSLLDLLKYAPTERNQGNCGNCWAWAGTGAMEIDYARQLGVVDRFSVQYLVSNYNQGCGSSGACCGGWLSDLASFYKSKKMAVPWSNANALYKEGSGGCGGCSKVSASSISTNPNYPLCAITSKTIPTQGVAKEAAISNIKNVLQQGKAIWFGFFLPDSESWTDFKSFWSNRPESYVWQPDFACGSEYSYSSGGGHAVLCVGYDDTDPKNRYWIMLNSWGTTAGRPAGLFRLNMDMSYDCEYSGLGCAFYWMTLDITYPNSSNDNSSSVSEDSGSAPLAPARPDGARTGRAGRSYSFTSQASDPDQNQIFYTYDWGDKSTSNTGFLNSGERAKAAHVWSKAGVYRVRVMATDATGASSPWSDEAQVRISSSREKVRR
ncbi:Papain family cysteine protease [uncultured archaeon]|nr:Papain family cysteine protease [uncultured archaeon]